MVGGEAGREMQVAGAGISQRGAEVPLGFAIGVSPGPPPGARDPEGGDALETLARDGVNLLRLPRIEAQELEGVTPGAGALPPSVQLLQETLDRALRAGRAAGRPLYVAANLGDLSALDGSRTRDRWLEYVVRRFGAHPALGAWKLVDEPNHAAFSDPAAAALRAQLRRGYARICALDGRHPCWITLAPQPAARVTRRAMGRYAGAADLLAVDLYPVSEPPGIHSGIRNRRPSAVGDFATRLAAVAAAASADGAAGRRRWVWLVLQGAGWSGTLPRDAQGRPGGPCTLQPTAALVRYMAYQAILHGAQGLLFFGMNVGLHPSGAAHGWDWGFWRAAGVPLLRELRGPVLEPVLRTIPLPPPDLWRGPRRRPAGDGSATAPRVDSRTLLAPDGAAVTIAACRERAPGHRAAGMPQVRVIPQQSAGAGRDARRDRQGEPGQRGQPGQPGQPGQRGQRAEVCFEGRSVPVQGGMVADAFVPWQVHVYRVPPAAGLAC